MEEQPPLEVQLSLLIPKKKDCENFCRYRKCSGCALFLDWFKGFDHSSTRARFPETATDIQCQLCDETSALQRFKRHATERGDIGPNSTPRQVVDLWVRSIVARTKRWTSARRFQRALEDAVEPASVSHFVEELFLPNERQRFEAWLAMDVDEIVLIHGKKTLKNPWKMFFHEFWARHKNHIEACSEKDPATGFYPLQKAFRMKKQLSWDEGLKQIYHGSANIRGFPFVQDPETGLFPFQAAAAAASDAPQVENSNGADGNDNTDQANIYNKNNEAPQLDSIFQLLRAAPAAITMGKEYDGIEQWIELIQRNPEFITNLQESTTLIPSNAHILFGYSTLQAGEDGNDDDIDWDRVEYVYSDDEDHDGADDTIMDTHGNEIRESSHKRVRLNN